MFLRQSPVSYRMKKSRVGKKLKQHTQLLFLVGVALLAIILTVIWGILWGEQAQRSAEARDKQRAELSAQAANTPDWLPAQPPEIRAAYLGRITTLHAAEASIDALLTEDTRALSVPLYTDGSPLYDSTVAQALGRQQAGTSDVTLTRLFAAILAADGYAAATFTCDWQHTAKNESPLRRTLRAYEGALIAEIAQSGADEVLLLGLDLSPETLDEVILFLRDLRADCPEATVGVAVPTAVMLDDHHVETTRAILAFADFIALDLSDSRDHTVRTTDEAGNTVQTTATVGQTLDILAPVISRYQMRLLLPTSMYEQLATIEELGYESWQIVR